MSLTFDEVRVKLGLQPFEKQAREHPERPGKTLAMVCHMLVAASEGKRLFLVAISVKYARQIAANLRAMASKLEIAVDVTIVSHDRVRDMFVLPNEVRGLVKGTYAWFWDHSVLWRRG